MLAVVPLLCQYERTADDKMLIHAELVWREVEGIELPGALALLLRTDLDRSATVAIGTRP